MIKAAEEGEIWEWRAFGRIPETLRKKIIALPIRRDLFGRELANLCGQDLYLISPASDQNIKLRKAGEGWFLKFKLLLTTEAHSIELYLESEKRTYKFPLKAAVVEETARLLKTALPEAEISKSGLDHDAFIDRLAAASPPISQIHIGKIRSQYQMKNGWIEVAEVVFPKKKIQSISLHAYERKAVEAMLERLKIESYLNASLQVMNYIEACRRWT